MSIDWQPPSELPDLRRVGIIALDTETRDGGLFADRGSAWPWGDGYICGVSVAWRDENDIRTIYVPVRHPDSANFDREQVIRWLRDVFASDVRIVTHNGLYDYGWLYADLRLNMPASERLEETGALATIVDENRPSYKLTALCAWRGLPGKDETLLRQACATLDLITNKRKKFTPQSHIWQLPAQYVGPYAEGDARNTLLLHESLAPVLDREGTRAAYRLECDLLPMVHAMRRRGIRIDTSAAEERRDLFLRKCDAYLAQLSEKLGTNIGMDELNHSAWRAEVFDQYGIAFPRTEKGNPSFTAGNSGWMPKHPHWLPQLIVKADKYNNAAVNFLETYILGHVVNGRVHAEIHPHRSDQGGTRSLRFSYSSPPLQLMPAHDEELAPLIRGVFLPEESETWAKCDVSQQEFRLICHYAFRHKLRGAQEAVERYRNDPGTDFHAFVAAMTGRDRQTSKSINFARAYGAGPGKFAAMIGKPLGEARVIFAEYDRKLPFVSELSRRCEEAVRRTGYLTLYDGARRHWNDWAPAGTWEKGAGPCPREEAETRVCDPKHSWYQRPLWRVDVRKAMNALIQGSAARHTKLWMRAVWRGGIVPLLQMHDSLDLSVSSPEQAELVAQLGRDAVQLDVPMKVDLAFGRTWGDAKHSWDDRCGAPEKPTVTVVQLPEPPTPEQVKGISTAESLQLDPFSAPFELPFFDDGDGHPDLSDALKHVQLADLIAQPLRSGMMRCPFHEDGTPSLRIYPDHYHCFGCGAHGNQIDWLIAVEGMSRTDAIEYLKDWNGPPTEQNQVETNSNRNNALRLWTAAGPIAGTLAARYLADIRGIDLAVLPPSVDDVLRFHPRCPFNGTHHPCLLALMRDVVTDEPTGIHRIALTSDGHKIERWSLGKVGAVKLWPAGPQLVVGEGLETVLAAATRIPYENAPLRPAWALGSSGPLGYLPVIPGVERLIILVDHDEVGITAALTCTERWTRAKRTVVRLTPDEAGADFNDLVLSE